MINKSEKINPTDLHVVSNLFGFPDGKIIDRV